ncbi:MAG: cytochrome c oxidase subunit 3 [Planctomycetota bacterium]|nr:cytochrome c oxidase subunit 3 [Planctomycetota bacterium]
MQKPYASDTDAGGGLGVLEPPSEKPRKRRRPKLDGWPPFGFGGTGGGGDDGGGGGGDDEEGAKGENPERPPGTAELGLSLIMVAIGTLFLIFLGAYVLMRKNATEWPPPGAPSPPNGLWYSTLILAACSATLGRALAAHRRHQRTLLMSCLSWSLALGLAFLAVQIFLWRGLFAAGLQWANGYGAIFYALTGLHAAHVLGGLLYLAKVFFVARADAKRSGPEIALRLCTVYWHFMGVIWLAIFLLLYFFR